MKPTTMLLAALMTAQIALAPIASIAHETKAGDLTVDHANSRPTLPNRPMAAYMMIMNEGAADDALVGASSPDFESIEIHVMVEQDGVMKMNQLDSIEVPADGAATLEPGGMHLMLFGAKTHFKEGDSFPVTLEFSKTGAVEVEVKVEKPGSGESSHSGHGSGHSN
ncbi:copper chaperone PCu(A)C [Rhodobacteraceae bacterium NNCM2]|nr:copper chaperone PCu(A)C [Coraliihabitans acroporae]